MHTSTAECFAVAMLSMALFLVGAGCAGEEGAVEEEDLPLAQVGDVIITAKQLREFSTALTGGELTGEARSERLRAHLQTMIDREILSKEAKKSGIQEDASFIQKMRKIRNSKLLQLFAVKQIKVGRDAGEVAEFIEKGRLTRAVKFSQIVVDSEEDAKAVTEEIRSGTTFEDAAEKWSRAEEATLVIGGREDGYSTKVNTHPSVRERLFSLEVGAVSEPIELSKGGYAVIKATSDTTITLDQESMQRALKELYTEKFRKARAAVAESLGAEYNLEFNTDGLDAFLRGMRDSSSLGRENKQNIVLYTFEGGQITAADVVDAAEAMRMGPETLMDASEVIALAEVNAVPEALFLEAARRSGLDQEEDTATWLEDQKQQLLLTEFREKLLEGKLDFSEEEVREYYDSHPDDFRDPELTSLQEILVATEEEARQLRKQIDQGASLGELAKTHSIRETHRDDEGRIEFHTFKKAHFGGLGEAAAKAAIGELVGPVAVDEGYSVFTVLSRDREKPAFEKIEKRVRATMRMRRKREIFDRHLVGLRQQYAPLVQVREDNMKKILDTPGS